VFCFISVFSQQKIETNEFLFESSNDSIDLINNFYDIYESLGSFELPSDKLYQSWNNYKIRYQYGDEIVKTDSTEIILIDTAHGERFVKPIDGQLTSHFGYRHSRFHYGSDIDLETGDNVRAAFDGVVRVTLYNKGYGKVVVIRHKNGLETVYSHLSLILVDSNVIVKAGDIIGLGGATGRATGSHLHFEIRYLGAAINSETIINYKNFQLFSDTIWLTQKNFAPIKNVNEISEAPKTRNEYHNVKKGENLSVIAKKHHTTISNICKLNGIKESHLLQIDEKLRVK